MVVMYLDEALITLPQQIEERVKHPGMSNSVVTRCQRNEKVGVIMSVMV